MCSTGIQPANLHAEVAEALFNRIPAGVALFDGEWRLQYCNAFWSSAFDRAARASETSDHSPIPLGRAALRDVAARVLSGGIARQDAVAVEAGPRFGYWDFVFAPAGQPAQPAAILAVATDVTARVLAYERLEHHVAERAHELTTLLEVSHNMASTLELQPLLGLILDQLRAVVPYEGASIFVIDRDVLTLVAYRGPIPQDEALRFRFPLAGAGVNRAVIEQRQARIIPDVRGESDLAHAFQQAAGPALFTTFGYIRSWMGVPLIHQERVVGMLSLDHGKRNHYTERHAQLAVAFAGQVAVAMENARLYSAEQERRAEAERRRAVAEGLRDILTVLNSNRSLDEILTYIVALAGRLLGAETGAIYRLEPKQRQLIIQASQGLPEDYVRDMQIPLGQGAVGLAVLQRRSVVVQRMEDIVPQEFLRDPVRRKHAAWLTEQFRSIIAVPLVIKDEIYGGIVLYFSDSRALSRDEVELAASFGDQAALAIENARLREQAEQAAVAAERSRLARDLHDAVTQTLFSASLIADVLPRLWERYPAEGRRRLEELRLLTRGALAEMRTLLLELRPSALTEASLGDLLRQLGEATTGRSRVPVTVTVQGKGPLPPDVQIAFYRIAQEALNNVAKHAGASRADVRLFLERGAGGGGAADASNASKAGLSAPSPGAQCRVELSVEDDGYGFDVSMVGPDHLGLGIMRERAESIGASLDIASLPGRGTRITATWEPFGE